jgi:hypothetical protein
MLMHCFAADVSLLEFESDGEGSRGCKERTESSGTGAFMKHWARGLAASLRSPSTLTGIHRTALQAPVANSAATGLPPADCACSNMLTEQEP